MAARLRTPEGIAAYRQRGRIAETPHGRIKHNMRFRQLSVRGNRKASGEWTFTVAAHNLMMAITSGNLTPAALAALAGQPSPGHSPDKKSGRPPQPGQRSHQHSHKPLAQPSARPIPQQPLRLANSLCADIAGAQLLASCTYGFHQRRRLAAGGRQVDAGE
jgi:hypothetical protein